MVLNTLCESISWLCLWKSCSHQKQQHLAHNCKHLYKAFQLSLLLGNPPFWTPALYQMLCSRRWYRWERRKILNSLWSVLSKCHISSLSIAESTLEVVKLQNCCTFSISQELKKIKTAVKAVWATGSPFNLGEFIRR